MTPTAAIVIIGNEILSGRTQDANIRYIAQGLEKRGIRLLQARVIPDDAPTIVATVRALAPVHTYLFTTGGIGATHDDRTAASLAEAFRVEIEEHPEALRRLQEHYGDALNAARRRMALMPVGSRLIDNPVSKAPGFQIHNVFALAGIPAIMQAMFDGLVGGLVEGPPIHTATIRCTLFENLIADELALVQERYPTVDIGSYPSFQGGTIGVVLVLRGIDAAALTSATQAVGDMIRRLGGEPTIERDAEPDHHNLG